MSNKLESYQLPFSFKNECSSNIFPSAEQQRASLISVGVKMENVNRERESIHSGQFMISTFEAEEAQDDLDDSEVKMLDPEDPNLSKLDETNTCMEMQLYVPQKITYQHKQTAVGNENDCGSSVITTHLEIETSLTKLFKCMNLAYSQKLTSPKWNHFKGVRLRWKDKIRLNNVIWRCWHMQFILKRRTPVCQFASPLDVDVHSKPQSILLEGKYWKRQLVVIKAEYRKWRRNYKTKVIGHLSCDAKSELDLLEWSPLNDRSVMISEDWTSDTLFSAINVPFPFPDPREIARGASIADFIQPSLGPLQPNLDDIDLTFAELLENSRLPPVPEEGAEEMLKVDYNFPIIANDGITTNNIMDVASTNVTGELTVIDADANMMELNTTLNSLPFNQIEQQFASNGSTNNIIEGNRAETLTEEDAIMSDSQQNPASAILTSSNPIISGSIHKNSNDFAFKKGRITKYVQRPFRREPHNYDKSQPTLHQTTIYQQMLVEQQQAQHIQQQQQQPNLESILSATVAPHSNDLFSTEQQSQLASYQDTSLPLNKTATNQTNNATECLNLLNNNFNIIHKNPANNNFTQRNDGNQFEADLANTRHKILRSDLLPMYNINSISDNFGAMGNINDNIYKTSYMPSSPKKSIPNDAYGNSVNQQIYVTQTSPVAEKNSNTPLLTQQLGNQLSNFCQTLPLSPGQHLGSSIVNQQNISINPVHVAPTTPSVNLQAIQLQMPQNVTTPQSLIYRSNSLPLNVSLQKLDGRDYPTVPKHQINKSCRPRTRSNSINQHALQIVNSNANPLNSNVIKSSTLSNINCNQPIQPATSDPLLGNAFAQLLTTNSQLTLFDQKHNEASLSNSPNNMPNVLGSTIMYITSNQMSPTHLDTTKSPSIIPSTKFPTAEVTIRQAHKHNNEDKHIQQQPPHKSPKKSASLPVRMPSTILSCAQSGINLPGSSTKIKPSTDLPLSPIHSSKYPKDTQRRVGHIHAEQKRRYNIKSGFDQLHDLIPQLQQSNAKLSKAAMLQKCADHIKHLRNERNVLKERIEALSKERDALNSSLTHLHSVLPANGAPVTRQGTEHVRQMFEQYVRVRSTENWKFWILGLILEPLLTSYTASVSSANMDELRRTAFLWVDQHCSLIDLRPAISNKLKYLSMKTDLLSEPPTTLEEEVNKAVNNSNDQHPNLHGT